MSPIAAFAPVARHQQAASLLLGRRPAGRGVVAPAVPVAFAVRLELSGAASATGRGAGSRAHWDDTGGPDRSTHGETA